MSYGPFYADLADLPEDERVAIIGKQAEAGKRVAFVVEDDAKAERYIRKLLLDFKVKIVGRGSGPVKGTVYVKVGPS
jgi:hypothetical protein